MRIVEWRPRHAGLLAQLWNASDAGWPQGLVHLRPKTTEEALEWERRTDSLGRFMVLDGKRPIGYVRVFEWWDSPDATYVQWLNVDPACHGKGVGKVLLLKAMERTMDLGYPRIDLHTWPGNDKAMPLYKRTGYMWVPGSHAYLQNYLPRILGYEPARGFFKEHEWYASLQRDLARDFDEERVRGIDSFIYRFRAGRDRLEVAIDRGARDVMAFEDRAVRVEMWIPDGALVKGQRGEIHWYVSNKGRRPMPVRIQPRRGLHFRAPRPFTLPPGGDREVKSAVVLREGFRDTPTEWASPSVRSSVVVGERAFLLASGFRPKPLVAFAWDVVRPHLPAPGRKVLVLVVRNPSGRALRGSLRLSAKGLSVRPERVRMYIPRGGVRRVRLAIDVPFDDARAVPLHVRLRAGQGQVAKTLVLPCIPPGGRLAYRDDKDYVLRSDAMCLVSPEVGAGAAVSLADRTKLVRGVYVAPGPPYWPFEGERRRWEGRVQSDGDPTIVRTLTPRRKPGLVVEQRWRLAGERLLEFRVSLENRGREATKLGVAVDVGAAQEHGAITLPAHDGPVTEALMENEWPGMREDVPMTKVLEEEWVHVGSDRGGFGMVWLGSRHGPGPNIELTPWSTPRWLSPPARLAPRARQEFGPVWFLLTRDWREVRALRSQIAGDEAKEGSATLGALHLHLEPGVVLASPAAAVHTTFRNLRLRPADGVARVEAPAGLVVTPKSWSVRGLRLDRDASRIVRVRGRGPDVRSATVLLDERRSIHRWTVPIVLSDSRGRIRLRGPKEQRVLSNGELRAVASATHGAALTSLRAGGQEYLVSSYPKPGSFSWFRPFYGGVHPFVFAEDWPGSLYKERFRVGLARRGTWTGIRLRVRAARSDLPKGIAVDVEYLTRPGSPMLVAALSLKNGTRERRTLTAGFWIFLGLGGKPSCEVEFDRLVPRRWREAPWSAWSAADGGFAVFRAPKARRAVAVLAAEPADLEVVDLRDRGRHGFAVSELELGPGESKTMLVALAVVRPEDAAAYRMLRNLSQASFEATRPR